MFGLAGVSRRFLVNRFVALLVVVGMLVGVAARFAMGSVDSFSGLLMTDRLRCGLEGLRQGILPDLSEM